MVRSQIAPCGQNATGAPHFFKSAAHLPLGTLCFFSALFYGMLFTNTKIGLSLTLTVTLPAEMVSVLALPLELVSLNVTNVAEAGEPCSVS